ncbi:MAG: sulfatase-like hydrolase/transferase [Bdellovibrionota bacterium]|jgi:arylsulfatase A-like enzyme
MDTKNLKRKTRIPLSRTLLIISSLFIHSYAVAQTAKPEQAVLITMDDMRPDDMQYMKNLAKFTEQYGVDVDRAFVSCPLCCPSRATMMTGLYASNHGVIGNSIPLNKQTIFQTFKQEKPEIKTGIIGKYLNSHDGEYKPEFDKWSVYPRGMIYNWFNFPLNQNGEWSYVKEYVSDYFLAQANEFVDTYIDDPYLLYLNFTAPHFPAQSPKSFKFSCANVKLPPTFNKIDKKAPLKYKRLTELDRRHMQKYACRRARSMAYIDSIIVPFIEKLMNRGVKVIFVSDNGLMIGDYRQKEKSLPYESVIRTPFLAFNIDIDPKRLTSLTDLAVNFYQDYEVTPPYDLDGLPYNLDRESLLVESFANHNNRKIPFTAIVTRTDINVFYQNPRNTKVLLKLKRNKNKGSKNKGSKK